MPRASHATGSTIAVLLALGLALAVGSIHAYSQQRPPTHLASPREVVVYGHIFVRVENVDARSGASDFYLPNVTVWLESAQGGKRTKPSATNAHGMFTSAPVAPGAYRVCWRADGFMPGCTGSDRPVKAADARTVIAGPISNSALVRGCRGRGDTLFPAGRYLWHRYQDAGFSDRCSGKTGSQNSYRQFPWPIRNSRSAAR
jgi:hypothetical protein